MFGMEAMNRAAKADHGGYGQEVQGGGGGVECAVMVMVLMVAVGW